jgi:rRNA maturation protein Rpf1
MLEKMEMNYVMGNPKIWEKQGVKNACRLCGQYVQKGEAYSIVVIPMPYRKEQGNFVVHTHEWEEFKQGVENMDILVEKLINTKKPKAKNATPIDETVVEAFKKVLQDKGYRIKKETRTRIYFKASRKMATFYFDKQFKSIEFEGRANGLFDGMFLREFYSRLEEALNKELGKEVEEGYRVNKAIQEAMDTVDKIMK